MFCGRQEGRTECGSRYQAKSIEGAKVEANVLTAPTSFAKNMQSFSTVWNCLPLLGTVGECCASWISVAAPTQVEENMFDAWTEVNVFSTVVDLDLFN